jgi:hypothetical protein
MRLSVATAMLVLVASVALAQDKGSISGTLLDLNHAGLQAAKVEVVGSRHLSTVTDRTGRFVINGLDPGRYKLRLASPGFKTKDLDVTVEPGHETSLNEVILELWPGPDPCLDKAHKPKISTRRVAGLTKARLVGTARVDAGPGLNHLVITLFSDGTSKPVTLVSTNDRGEFRFEDVAPGSYYLEISRQGSELTKVNAVHVRDGYEVEVRLSWSQPSICL